MNRSAFSNHQTNLGQRQIQILFCNHQNLTHIPTQRPYINKAIERALQTRKTNKDMAMAMALRRLASSIDKPIRPLFNGASLYYMVLSLYLSFYF